MGPCPLHQFPCRSKRKRKIIRAAGDGSPATRIGSGNPWGSPPGQAFSRLPATRFLSSIRLASQKRRDASTGQGYGDDPYQAGRDAAAELVEAFRASRRPAAFAPRLTIAFFTEPRDEG